MELSKLKFSPPSYTKEEESAVAECIRINGLDQAQRF